MAAIILCFVLIAFPERALAGAGLGLELCLKAVVPSLLPFMLISTIAVRSGWGVKLGRLLSVVLRPLFGLGPAASMCLVTGLLGGYPCGARAAAQCAENGLMTKDAAERALAFCNNSGPLFIIGTAGVAIYGSAKIGAELYVCHVLGALAAAAVFGRGTGHGAADTALRKQKFGSLVGDAAMDCGAAILSVCSLVITFSALIEALRLYRWPAAVGFFEVSRGVKELGRFGEAGLPLAAACLSWGGFSVHFQTEAVAPGLSKKYYYAGKIISTLISGLAMLVCVKLNKAGIV